MVCRLVGSRFVVQYVLRQTHNKSNTWNVGLGGNAKMENGRKRKCKEWTNKLSSSYLFIHLFLSHANSNIVVRFVELNLVNCQILSNRNQVIAKSFSG